MIKLEIKSNKFLKYEIFRFILIGLVNNVFYYSAFLSIIYILKFHYSISVFLAYLISIITGYLMNTKFTFKIPNYKINTFIKYTILYLTSYSVNIFILYILIDLNNFEAWYAQLFGTLIVAIYNYIILKFYVYKK